VTLSGRRSAATSPQAVGYSLADTPVGLAAWLLDHDAVTCGHLARLFAGQPYGVITRDDWLDNTSLYWLTNTARNNRNCSPKNCARRSTHCAERP
jgi:hypothetical protein